VIEVSKHPCFVAANKSLADSNTEMDFAYMITEGGVRPIIATMKIDSKKRGSPKRLLASFCPFCGSELMPKATPQMKRSVKP
jgi:hypothetical protein